MPRLDPPPPGAMNRYENLFEQVKYSGDRFRQLDMDFVRGFITSVSPIFLITSPVTSYADQIYSIHRSRSLGGFSLDIPLIMLVASITKVFYWFGVHYDRSLLIQACLMIVVQTLLLHVALANRPAPNPEKDLTNPFSAVREPGGFSSRPFDFWRWRTQRAYWQFLAYFTGVLVFCQLLVGGWGFYVQLIGYLALAVEGTLPLPQIYNNHVNRSSKGFRLSVLINWLVGDMMKMSFFFLSDSTITWPFKLCGLFQFACDIYLGIQFLRYGSS